VDRHPLSLVALALVAASCARTGAPRGPAPLVPPSIDSMALRSHTFFLAHDLLEGRGTGRRGADVAALYLASEAERIGLQGAGPGGSFFQEVPIVEATVDSARTRLALTDAGNRQEFPYGTGFIPNVGTARTLVGFGGEVVYVGSAQDVLAAPSRLPPLAGRVVLLAGMFGAEAAAADTLRTRGATGVIHLVGDDERYQLYVRSRGPSRMFLDEAAAASSFIPDIPAVIASPSLSGPCSRGSRAQARPPPGSIARSCSPASGWTSPSACPPAARLPVTSRRSSGARTPRSPTRS